VNDIAEALDEQKWELTQATLERYTNDLLDHISVENDEVFIMAETLFSDTELERIYFLFQDIDIKLGQERKQQLAAILNHIQNT
jgi:hemerythrin-like domain-containing protein